MAGTRYTHSTESSGIRYGGKRAFHSLQVLESGTANFIRLFRILISIPRKQGVPSNEAGRCRKTTALNQPGERVAGHLGTTVQLEKQFGGNPVRSPSISGGHLFSHLHHLQQARNGRLFPFRRRKALHIGPQATGRRFSGRDYGLFKRFLVKAVQDLFSLQRSHAHSGQEENQQITFHHQSSGQPGGIPAIVD